MPRTPRRNSPCRRGRRGSNSRRRSRSSTGPEAINWVSSASSSPIIGSLTFLNGSTVNSSDGISSNENVDAETQFIIMNEHGQTPDHLYLARTLNPTVGRTQVRIVRNVNQKKNNSELHCIKQNFYLDRVIIKYMISGCPLNFEARHCIHGSF